MWIIKISFNKDSRVYSYLLDGKTAVKPKKGDTLLKYDGEVYGGPWYKYMHVVEVSEVDRLPDIVTTKIWAYQSTKEGKLHCKVEKLTQDIINTLRRPAIVPKTVKLLDEKKEAVNCDCNIIQKTTKSVLYNTSGIMRMLNDLYIYHK